MFSRLLPYDNSDRDGGRRNAPVRTLTIGDVSLDPYYNFIDMVWDFNDLSAVRSSDLDKIVVAVGSRGAAPSRKLGFGMLVPYFSLNNIEHYKNLTKKLCEVSEQTTLPVLICLDGYELWSGRPDLWNWWDPRRPGYDPNNKRNVEWTSWSADDAVRGGWRNWGRAFQMQEPHPNLTSPAVLEANKSALTDLVPIIKTWYDGLPENKKFLFGGIRLGYEVGIGLNYYYPFPGGSTDDPAKAQQVGYAAVKTAGIRSSGELTQADVTRAVQCYMMELSKTVYELGIPRRKIFTHCGAKPPAKGVVPRFATTDSALNAYAHPGWSFYTENAGPDGLAGLDATLDKVASTFWGNCEWGGVGPAGGWQDILTSFASKRNNKFVNSFAKAGDAEAAGLRTVIDRGLDGWMHPPLLHAKPHGNSATLTWRAPSEARDLYLNVTTNPEPAEDGGFTVINVANERVTGNSEWVLSNLRTGIYYCLLFADGSDRRVISDLTRFDIRGPDFSWLSALLL